MEKKTFISSLDKKEKILNAKEKELTDLEQSITQAQQELKNIKQEFEQSVKNKAEELRTKEKRINEEDISRRASIEAEFSKKDKEFKAREASIVKVEQTWAKVQSQLQGVTKAIEQKRVESHGLDQQLVELRRLKLDVQKKQEQFHLDTGKKNATLKLREETILTDEQSVKNARAKMLWDVQEKQKILKQREQACAEKEIGLAKKQLDAQKSVEQLMDIRQNLLTIKAGLAQDFELAKTSWGAAKAEWDQKMSIFAQNRLFSQNELKRIAKVKLDATSLLEAKEQEIRDLIKELESDQKSLEQEERSLINKIKKLEQDDSRQAKERAAFENARKEYSQVREQAQHDATIIQKEWEKLRAAKDKIARVKELKADLPKLERHHAEIMSNLEKAEAKLIAITTQYEHKISERNQGAHVERVPAHHKVQDIIKEARENKGKIHGVSEDDVYVLIAKAHHALKDHNTDDAVRFTSEAEVMASQIKDMNKKVLYYDLQELKTNIKLAGLA